MDKQIPLGINNTILPFATALSGAVFQPSSQQILRNVTNPQAVDEFNRQVLEEQKQEDIPDSQQNMFENDISDETTPLLKSNENRNQQPVLFLPNSNQYNMIGGGPGQVNPLIEQIVNQRNDNIPEEQKEDFNNWRDRLVNAVQQLPSDLLQDKMKFLKDFANNAYMVYLMYHEYDLLAKFQDDQKQRSSPEDNHIFMEETQKKVLPKHCRRHYFTDSNGILRSTVICDAFGQRVYKDQ